MHDQTSPENRVTGASLGIRRIGKTVTISVESPDEYVAIELYERLVEGAKAGALKLDLATR